MWTSGRKPASHQPAGLPLAIQAALVTAVALVVSPAAGARQQDAFRFRTGIDLVNVTATVTDGYGRFVAGLKKEDFSLLEDGRPQTITHFSADRVPVSLGIVLDTSSSMDGEKIVAARRALDRFLRSLLDPADEVFLYCFDNSPRLVSGWTTDRRSLLAELERIQPHGGTAMYDALAEAVPLAQTGKNRKKAIILISDGNDTSSHTDVMALKQLIRETEVLVYAVGIDAQNTSPFWPDPPAQAARQLQRPPGRPPIPLPFPLPGRRPPGQPPPRQPVPPAPTWPRPRSSGDDRVNVVALREITDDSGGRTEIIRSARDLDPATAGIADELSKQYYLGYSSSAPKDSRWHRIDVQVNRGSCIVRARRGYVASP